MWTTCICSCTSIENEIIQLKMPDFPSKNMSSMLVIWRKAAWVRVVRAMHCMCSQQLLCANMCARTAIFAQSLRCVAILPGPASTCRCANIKLLVICCDCGCDTCTIRYSIYPHPSGGGGRRVGKFRRRWIVQWHTHRPIQLTTVFGKFIVWAIGCEFILTNWNRLNQSMGDGSLFSDRQLGWIEHVTINNIFVDAFEKPRGIRWKASCNSPPI